MKQYQLLQDYRGIPANTLLFGPYPITGGGTGYFQQKDIPTTDQGGTQCLFASFVEQSSIFKLVTQ